MNSNWRIKSLRTDIVPQKMLKSISQSGSFFIFLFFLNVEQFVYNNC